MGKKTKKVRGIIGRIRKAEADLVKAPIVEGANYLSPPNLIVDHPLGLGRQRAAAGAKEDKNLAAQIKKALLGGDKAAVEKMNQGAAAKAAADEKPVGTGLGLTPPDKTFTAGDEKGQRSLFGEHDMIVNAMEMEEKSIQAEIDWDYDRISRIQRDIDGLRDRLDLVHRANVRSKKLAGDAQAAKDLEKPGKPGKTKPQDKPKDNRIVLRRPFDPLDPPAPKKVKAPAKAKNPLTPMPPAEDPVK
jgi:hypothetical protein